MRACLFLTVVLLFACGSAEPPAPTHVPVALQPASGVDAVVKDIRSSVPRMYKNEDLVASMFAEVVAKDSLLAKALKDVERHRVAHVDSMRSLNEFLGNNTAFYQSAHGHIDRIQDSLDRAVTVTLVQAHEERYADRVAGLLRLQEEHAKELQRVDELLERIMIERTMHLMEAYQRGGLPTDVRLKADLERLRTLRTALEGHGGM